jgi:hypothetical protein
VRVRLEQGAVVVEIGDTRMPDRPDLGERKVIAL